MTQRAQLEHLIVAADAAVIETLELDSAKWKEYFSELRSNEKAGEKMDT